MAVIGKAVVFGGNLFNLGISLYSTVSVGILFP